MRSLRLLLTFALLLGQAAPAQRIADIQKLPLLADPTTPTPKQVLTPADRSAVQALLSTLNSTPEVRGLHKDWPYFEHLAMQNVLFTIVAPFRSAQPERLTVFHIYEGEPPVLLFVLSSGRGITADLIEPVSNLNLCGTQSGYSLRDINQNGKREIALTIGCGDGPWAVSMLHLFEYAKTAWQPLGNLAIEEQMGADQPYHKINKIYVRKSKNPQIYSVQYLEEWQKGQDNQKTSPPTRKTTRLILNKLQADKVLFRVKHLF